MYCNHNVQLFNVFINNVSAFIEDAERQKENLSQ